MLIFPIINLFLIASAATCCSYWLFYYFSPFIWSFNSTLPLNEYVPWARDHFSGHAGVQVYVLYLLMLMNLGFSFILNTVSLKIKNPFLKYVFLIFLSVLLIIFFNSIRFHVPMAQPAATFPEFVWVGAVFFVALFISLRYRAWWMTMVVFVSLFIVCLATATEIDRNAYIHFLAPAWRLLHGFGFNSYFQYDCLIPILTAGWLKLFPLETISLLGRLSYLALFFGAYLFAKRFFHHKQLAGYLLISVVIIKVYGNIVPPDGILQVTPLRLDWWIVLLALAYWKGASHWSVGASLGFLIIFLHSFGCIYTLCYLVFILVLIALELAAGKGPFADVFKKFFFLYFKNLTIILMGFLLYKILLSSQSNVAIYFQQAGVDFLRISRQSFYWYMPVVFASVFLLLCRNRPSLSPQFFETSILLLSLAIGNSMYFFGRSHENNIINIAAILMMALFLLLDLVQVQLNLLSSSKLTRWALPVAASAVVLIISYQYADRAVKLVDVQSANLKNHSFVANSLSDFQSFDFSQLKTLTHSSPKVIFISQMDFFFYYYGKYALPENYHCYMFSWFIMKDYVNYLNDRLNKGYYIVVNPQEIAVNSDTIKSLNAHYFSNTSDLLVISNNPLRGFDKTLWYR